MSKIVLWVFSDGRKGHDKQTTGLVQAISRTSPFEVEVQRVVVSTSFKKLSRLPKPNLIIGAGNATHLPMLISKLLFSVPCVVLMKPSLPTICFDLVLVPHHDACTNFGNVRTTTGVLCPIPNTQPDVNSGVILLGGSSRHFQWDTELVVSTVENICAESNLTDWTICDSPRSPPRLLDEFATIQNATTRHWGTTNETYITNLLNSSSQTWVTCDSVTMLYEALCTGSPVGIIEMPPTKKNNKLVRGIADLANDNRIQLSSKGYSMNEKLSVTAPGEEICNYAEMCLGLIKPRVS